MIFPIQKQSGLALIIVLIFLQIITILGLYAMESAIEVEKMAYLDEEQSTIFWIAKQIQWNIATQLTRKLPDCLIQVTPQNDLLNKPISWWQSSNSCKGDTKGFSYFYVIEKIGTDPCANISDKDNYFISFWNAPIFYRSPPVQPIVEYLRITLVVFDQKKEAKEVLQSTIITLDNAVSEICQGVHHAVMLGQQMWREPR